MGSRGAEIGPGALARADDYALTSGQVVKPMRISTIVLAGSCFVAIGAGYGCWHQFPSPTPQLYQFSSSPQTPVGAAYPGTRELMDAPSNDPALNNDRNGVELRP
jgi:hypothetical protein